jgi:outer membrane receptor protein involved in Fe transport
MMFSRITALGGASALAIFMAGTAVAQTQEASPEAAQATPTAAAPAEADTAAEDVIVTGSRIPTNGFRAPTPITVTTAAELNAASPTTIGDALRQLPALSASAGPRGAQTSSGQGGAYLNLRNLGSTRTLTLFDGKRFIPNDGSGQVDTNLFPQALVERVEVVTGGASAAYGSDAVAGVVNFIVNKKFTGLTGGVQAGISTYGDNSERKADLSYGTKFADGRGHFILSGEYYFNQGEDDRINRPYSAQSCQPISLPAGSATSRTFACNVRVSNAAFGGLITGPTAFRGTTFDASGNPVPFVYGTQVTGSTMVGGSGVSPQFAPLAALLDKKIAYSRLSYDVNDALTLFAEGNYGDVRNQYQVGSYSNQIGSTALTIRRDNAYLPAALRTQMLAAGVSTLTMGRYDGDLPRTIVNVRQRTLRGVAGAEGSFLGGLKWNVYGEIARNKRNLDLKNDLIQANYVAAADAVVSPTGQIVCRSTLTSPTNGCVPVNVFGNNPVSSAALNYVTGTNSSVQIFHEYVAAGSIAGKPFALWAGDVGFAAGVEYRKQDFNQTVDALSEAYNSVTNAEGAYRVGNAKAQSGAVNVKEAFLELEVPLLKDVPLFQALDFNGAVRRTDYSTSGAVTTWKAGLSWQVYSDLRLRGTRSRDIRAPSLYELFQRGTTAYQAQVFDRVTNTTASNVRTVTLGNTNLRPEVANTTTFGLVYSPSFLRGFDASVDFYNINIRDAITSLSFTQELDDCYNGSAASCALIQRNSAGALSQINIVTQNLASFKTRGIDFEAGYRSNLSWLAPDAKLSLRQLRNYIDSYVQTTPGVVPVDRAGQIGVAPHWRLTEQTTLDMGNFSLFAQGRFIGGGYYDKSTAATDLPQRTFHGQLLVDTRLSAKVPGTGNLETYLSVTNVFNRLVNPYVVNVQNDFDTIGRTFRVGARFSY